MDTSEFDKIVKDQHDRCISVLFKKSEEYSTPDDKLHNFKAAAALQNTSPEVALGGMLAKHLVSIFDLIGKLDHPIVADPPMSLWDEKITDAMNYMYLLRALLDERSRHIVLNMSSVTDGISTRAPLFPQRLSVSDIRVCANCNKEVMFAGPEWIHVHTHRVACDLPHTDQILLKATPEF